MRSKYRYFMSGKLLYKISEAQFARFLKERARGRDLDMWRVAKAVDTLPLEWLEDITPESARNRLARMGVYLLK